MTLTEFIEMLRAEEIRIILERHSAVFVGRDLLEIGSGSGTQLRILSGVCASVNGIEIADRDHACDRFAAIHEYDGQHFPFSDASFDVIFSSNVIEHIKDERTLHSEMHRVLRPNGVCIHSVPTATWRIWASLGHYPSLARSLLRKLRFKKRCDAKKTLPDTPKVTRPRWRARLHFALIQQRHGVFGNWFTEHFLFSTAAWRKRFAGHGWVVESSEPVGLALSGHCLLGEHLSWRTRRWLSKIIGSGNVLFVLRE